MSNFETSAREAGPADIYEMLQALHDLPDTQCALPVMLTTPSLAWFGEFASSNVAQLSIQKTFMPRYEDEMTRRWSLEDVKLKVPTSPDIFPYELPSQRVNNATATIGFSIMYPKSGRDGDYTEVYARRYGRVYRQMSSFCMEDWLPRVRRENERQRIEADAESSGFVQTIGKAVHDRIYGRRELIARPNADREADKKWMIPDANDVNVMTSVIRSALL